MTEPISEMNEPPTNASQRRKRSKTLRMALASLIALQAALCVASMIWRFEIHSKHYQLDIGSGELRVFSLFSLYNNPASFGGPTASIARIRGPIRLLLWPRYEVQTGGGARSLTIPLWIPIVALLSVAALLVYRDRTRRQPGHCRQCGYNLTGNTTGRCPECGTVVQGAGQRPAAGTLES